MTSAACLQDQSIISPADLPEEVKQELLSIVRLAIFDNLSTYQIADKLKLPPDFIYDVIDGLHDVLGMVLADPGRLASS